MNLLATLHARWAAATALNTLLPIASVTTGVHVPNAADPSFPFGTIERSGDGERSYTDGGAYQDIPIQMTVYNGRNQYDEGLAIADAVEDAFDRTDFALASPDTVLVMRLTGREELEDDDGNWSFVLGFNCHTYLG